jgi:hypothetical protein
MLRKLRILLMWLVALAVPVQGFAAASMLGCGPGHHGTTGAQAHAGPMHEHASGTSQHAHGVDLDGDSSSHHPDASAAAAHGDTPEAPAEGKSGAGSCSACASCCLAAALPATALSFEASSVADFIALSIPRSPASFFTDGPERPPRLVLA